MLSDVSAWSTDLHEEQEDLLELLSESDVADNYGRRIGILSPGDDGDEDSHIEHRPYHSLETGPFEALEGLRGHRVIVSRGDESYYGMVAHRGIMTADEFESIDWEKVAEDVAASLGSSAEEMEVLYGGSGRPSASKLARRAQIDESLLQVKEAGGNMHQLAVALGWSIETTPTGVRCRKMAKALCRAQEARCA